MKKRTKGMYILGAIVCGILMLKLPAYANSMNVQKHTKEEIISYINTTKSAITSTITYTVTPNLNDLTNTSAIGSLSETTVNSALARLNQYRYIAGLDADVTSDTTYAEKAQAAAFINASIGKGLSHGPAKPAGMSDNLYSLCYGGTSSANLGAGYGDLPYAVDGWVGDRGVNSLGHRRWVLNPSMGKTGFGLVQNAGSQYRTYTAMYAFDRSRSSSYTNVAWPAQVTPLTYFNSSSTWSLSTGKKENVSAITVTLTRTKDKKVWTFNGTSGLTVNNEGYGQTGCLMFTPADIGTLADGDVFTVSITGLTDGDLTYQVEFFDETKTTDSSGDTTAGNTADKDDTSDSDSSDGQDTTNHNTGNDGNTNGSLSGKETTSSSTTLSKVSKFKVTAGKKKLTLSWKKKSGITGYQIQIATNKSFKSAQTYTIGKSTTKKAITKYKGKKLVAKKRYYVRIRAYKKNTDAKGKVTKKYSKWVSLNQKTK